MGGDPLGDKMKKIETLIEDIHELLKTNEAAEGVDIDKVVVDTLNLDVRPFKDTYEVDALKTNGLKWNDVLKFEDHRVAYKKIVNLLDKYMPFEERQMYDKREKFHLCAYNGKTFDIPYLNEFFKRNGDKRMWRYFDKVIDPFEFLDAQRDLAKTAGYKFPLKSLKLTSLCELFGIELEGEAHTAQADTIALRDLLYKLGSIYKLFSFDQPKKKTRKKNVKAN